jgi:hypothetical protein
MSMRLLLQPPVTAVERPGHLPDSLWHDLPLTRTFAV